MPPHGDSAVKSRCRGEQGRPAERKMLFAPVTVRGRRGSRDRSAQRSARGAARGAGARTCTGEQAETLGASSEPSAGPFAPLMEAETEQGRGRRGPRRTLRALGRSLPCSVSASEGRAKRPAEGSENSPSRRGPPLLLPRSVSASLKVEGLSRGGPGEEARVNGGSKCDSLKVEGLSRGGPGEEARVNGGSNYDSLKVRVNPGSNPDPLHCKPNPNSDTLT